MFVSGLRWCCWCYAICFLTSSLHAAESIRGGFGKVDITHYEAGPVSDPLHARALVLEVMLKRYVIISLDVVALERIGPLPANFLANLRDELQKRFQIEPENVLVNTSHCHGISAPDVLEKTISAVALAIEDIEPVRLGVGVGKEDRISQNRRLLLKSGREADYRHAYSLPPDEEIEGIGPIDPDVTVLKVVAHNESIKGIVYQFACHPIQGTPSGGNTADITGYASKVIEDQLGTDTVALFLQGCGGDINPIGYKEYAQPREAEKLGNLLALTALKTTKEIEMVESPSFSWKHKMVAVPLADLGPTIATIEEAREQLVNSIQGTTLNFKEFQKLLQTQGLFQEYPTSDKGAYLHQQEQQREWLKKLDEDNRNHVRAYLNNIYTMESISRLQTNLKLLRMHQQEIAAIPARTLDVEMVGLRVGPLKLISFPGELTVRIGLELKQRVPGTLMVCGYSNGYIYYAPTATQLANRGYAQEDSDCLLAPHWQDVFEQAALELVK